MAQRVKTSPTIQQPMPWKWPVLIGSAVGLIMISWFVFGVDNPRPEWGAYWRVRPLIVTPMAGALGGLFYYLMDYLASKRGLNRRVVVLFSVVVFTVGLWMGIVLGLAGTMWN